MTTEETELTFVRCPNCRSLVPAVASRCRMCGHHFEMEAEESGDQGGQKKSRVRQRTISVSKDMLSSQAGEEGVEAEAEAESEAEAPFAFSKSFGESYEFGEGEDLLHEPEELDETPPPSREPDAEPEPEERRPFRAFDRDEESDRPTAGLKFGRNAVEENLGAETGFGDDDFDSEGDDEDDGSDAAEDANVPRRRRRRRRRRRGGAEAGAQAGSEARSEEPLKSEPPKSEPPKSEPPKSEPARPTPAWGGESSRTEGPRNETLASPVFRPDRPERQERSETGRTEPLRTESLSMRGENMGTQESGFDEEKVGRGDRGPQFGGGKGKSARRDEHGTLLGWMVNYSTDSKGVAIELRGGRYFVGRQRLRDDDLVIADSSISTPHCLLFVSRGEGLRVQDLMSEHGTYVKKRGTETYAQVHDTVEVQHGDWIRFGTYEVTVCLVP